MQNFIGDFSAVVKRKFFWRGENFWVKLGWAPSEIGLEPFSGYTKLNLEQKVVLSMEII